MLLRIDVVDDVGPAEGAPCPFLRIRRHLDGSACGEGGRPSTVKLV